MAKLARLPAIGRSSGAETEHPRVPRLRTRFYAFLSYSHKDKELADWLHRELERFRVPHALAGKLTANGVVPRRLVPIFRDQQDLSAGGDLAEEIKAALAASQFLVVLCSPTAAKSRWTNQEIESFKRTRPEGCVLAAVVAGEPFASDMPGREDEECFPPALRYKYDRRGHQTAKRAEPLAADFREGGEGKRLAFLKLVAGMLGVGLDELVQRDQTRRHRQLAWLAAGSLAGMAVTSTLAVTAIEARDAARDQRRQAEGLVEFMLGDLKDKLEPIGKLDVLDGVGSRVLDYYSKQDTKQLSDVGLAQRSKALTLMGQISRDRGELNRAEALYRQAYAGTAEEVSRKPNDPQRIYDHAQNAFYISDIAFRRGDLGTYVAASREYKRLADRMVALDPNNMKWRMETNYADFNLGIALYDQRHFRDAAQQFGTALATMQALASADPTNDTYQSGVADALTWVASAQEADGRLDQAVQTRKQYVALLERLLPREGADARFRLIQGHRDLGSLYAQQGKGDLALQEFNAAVAEGEKLLALDATNAKWLQSTQASRLLLAEQLLDQGQTAQAAGQLQPICATYAKLVAKDSTIAQRSAGYRDCLMTEARVAARSGQKASAAAFGMQAVRVARSVSTIDRADARFGLAAALRLVGDIRRSGQNPAEAQAAWSEALATIPSGATEKPSEMDEHALILERLGRSAEAAALKSRLEQIGYRRTEVGGI
jgi:tetratricopeptide (TPR) repeat protein